jgi:hypothetical protein
MVGRRRAAFIPWSGEITTPVVQRTSGRHAPPSRQALACDPLLRTLRGAPDAGPAHGTAAPTPS